MQLPIVFSGRRAVLTKVIPSMLIVALGVFGGYQFIGYQKEVAREQKAKKAEAVRIAKVERKKKEPVYITLPNAQPIRALVDDYTQPNSLWAIVNKTTPPLPDGFKPTSLVVPNVPTRSDKGEEERSVHNDVAKPLETMFREAKLAGHALMVGSAYRSAALQEKYFNSYESSAGLQAATLYSAKPGSSEHQLGLSVDISTESRECYLSECFTALPDGEWLASNAYKYGFTLRYKKGKEAITGYNFEPWHYRYVGVDLATALQQSDLTIEEAWPYLQGAFATLKKNGAI